MNNLLELKGKRFFQKSRSGAGGGASMNSKKEVTMEQVSSLIDKLYEIKKFWEYEDKPFKGILISVYYNKIVAKSNRISGLLKGKDSNLAIVGVKFDLDKNKHIITYFIDMQDLDNSINLLRNVLNLMSVEFMNGISKNIFDNDVIFKNIKFEKFGLSKTNFKQVIADVSYVESFDIEISNPQLKQSIVTLFNTGTDVKDLFRNIGIEILSSRILDNQTVFLDEIQLKFLLEKAPYLISMSTIDLSKLSIEDFIQDYRNNMITIPSPSIEPTIGVIDTLFDDRVYFSNWVDYHDMVKGDIKREQSDYEHGTSVSSIIVDGPQLNPWLDDNCGRFKVRHFGVAIGSKFSSFSIVKQIKTIIANNRDIKVWNFSLGSDQEINDNFISAEAAVLDEIQYEYDVIFVVSGTNRSNENIVKIGSPADSINSVVVNSVTKSGISTKYSRRGPALSFFSKPDISYYGGSEEEYIRVCSPLGEKYVSGTSYASPWIARKLSYLIDILGLGREVAKALIIDSARGWNGNLTLDEVALYGHGVVPIKIDDIIKTNEDEIKFLVSDVSEKWNTYNYNFPVPLKDDKYPFVSKVTMCYFPACYRTQGVDYTSTELNLHFGRIKDDGTLNEINGDKQNQDDLANIKKNYLLEGEARNRFRKWDNVKCITEIPSSRKKAKKSYKNKNWGIEVKTNNRLNFEDGVGIRFGIVVTLKEINGVNRIDEFIRNCNLSGWLVNELDVKNKVDIYKKLNEEIEFNQNID